MSGEIDLAVVHRDAHLSGPMAEYVDTQTVLALIRAVRAARKLAPRVIPQSLQGRAFLTALSPFTDSAEVRSDGT